MDRTDTEGKIVTLQCLDDFVCVFDESAKNCRRQISYYIERKRLAFTAAERADNEAQQRHWQQQMFHFIGKRVKHQQQRGLLKHYPRR